MVLFSVVFHLDQTFVVREVAVAFSFVSDSKNSLIKKMPAKCSATFIRRKASRLPYWSYSVATNHLCLSYCLKNWSFARSWPDFISSVSSIGASPEVGLVAFLPDAGWRGPQLPLPSGSLK